MSLFDQPYYALTKAHMSRMGIWPEQSKYLIRLHDAWRDVNILTGNTTFLLIGIGLLIIVLRCIHHVDDMKLLLKKIEKHWEIIKNTSAVIVLDRYAEQGRYITVIYLSFFYFTTTLFFGLCLSPTILDFVHPINETRPKIYIVETEYGVDANKYYWFIIAHTYIVVTIGMSLILALGTMYILWVVHACALFEVVGFNLELIENEYAMNKDKPVTFRSDWNYKKICDCIILHAEAISFANLIEDIFSGAIGVILVIIAFIAVISGVQVLINWKHPEMVIQQVAFIIGQVQHLYIINIPGQLLINHSGKIHTTAYNLDWQDMSAIAQKLLILILMRSSKPCYFTAGRIYVLSMETFGSVIRIMISYFTIFAQMI